MKTLGVILLFFITSNCLISQNIRVKGVIKDSDGQVVSFANVYCEENPQIGTTTDINGNFEFEIPVNFNRIVISFIGMRKKVISIEKIQEGEINLGTIILEKSSELNLVEISDLKKINEGQAIELTKKSIQVVNIISEEGLTKLPDKNGAEALQRIPGVVIERNHGEGRYVSFRGTPFDWSSTLINGERLPAADETSLTRAINFDILPSTLVEYILVYKTLTPDIEGDAIGGSANFISRKAHQGQTLKGQIAGGMNGKTLGPIINSSFVFGNTTINKKISYLAGVSYYDRSWGTDNYQLFYGGNFNHSISRLELRRYDGRRKTIGGNLAFNYTPNDKHSIDIRGVYGQMTDDEFNRKTIYAYATGLGQSIKVQNINSIKNSQCVGIVLNGTHQWSQKLKTEWQVSSYNNRFRYGNVPLKNRSPYNGYFVTEFEKGVQYEDVLFVDEDGNITDEFNAFSRDKLLDIDSPFDSYGDPYYNVIPIYRDLPSFTPNDTALTFTRAYTETVFNKDSDPVVLKIDFTYDKSKVLQFKFGGKYRYKMGERIAELNIWDRNAETTPIILYRDFELANINSSRFLSEFDSPYDGRIFPYMTDRQIKDFIQDNGDNLVFLPFDVTTPYYEQFIGSSYTYFENVGAAYAIVNAKINEKVIINAGVRIEYTQTSVGADTVIVTLNVLDRTLEDRTVELRYWSPLPMLTVKYNINNKNILKGVITRSFRRPNFNEVKPAQAMIDYTNFDVVFGNPNLKPTFSWNADLIFEKYNNKTGLFTFGVYGKSIKDHIFTSFESADLSETGISNEFQVPGGVISKKYQNAPNAYVLGAETGYYSKLNFLPKPFNDLGINFTAAYSYGRMNIEARKTPQLLPRQSDWVGNAAIFYENKNIITRLAMNYRSPYLMELNLFAVKNPQTGIAEIINQTNEYDMFMWRNLMLDFSFAYRIGKSVFLFAEINNLTNAPFVIYRGQRERPVKTEFYSQRGLLGIKFDF